MYTTFTLFRSLPLVHGVFKRQGGVSTGAFNSLNLGFTQGDIPECVKENRKRACNALQIEQVSSLYQVHSSDIVCAHPKKKQQADGLITNTSHLGLLILHADCQAAIFYDPIHHALANVHCGWRGNVANIYAKCIAMMRAQYGTKPADLLIGISPSLGPKKAEFKHYKDEFPQEYWQFQKNSYFNLWELARYQLEEAGVLPHHIEIAGICTYSHPEDYFSYRRVKQSGRHGTLAMLL